jgi:ubiquinone/menaquinone biosynthesis methyltransferase
VASGPGRAGPAGPGVPDPSPEPAGLVARDGSPRPATRDQTPYHHVVRSRVSLSDAFVSPEAKLRYNRRLFGTIADRYDLITVVLSYGRDRRWKERLIELAGIAPGDRVLDLACGTGDLALLAGARGARVTGLDLVPRMLALARAKTPAGRVAYVCGDMGGLPFADGSVDVVTSGYGLRNVPRLEAALAEIRRVLRPSGRFLSLDFNRPRNRALRSAYLAYLTAVGSTLGLILHRDPDAYRYIPASLRRYPEAEQVAARLVAAGFAEARWLPVLGGLMAIHVARK